MNHPYFIAKNIQYLIKGVGLTIAEFAALLDLDPVDLYLASKAGYLYDQFDKTETKCLLSVCNYFTVKLDDLVLSDIEADHILPANHFDLLKNELNGEEFDRKPFRNKVFEDIYLLEQIDNVTERIEGMRKTLLITQSLYRYKKRYDNGRAKGVIEKNDFLSMMPRSIWLASN